jgi:hypothetical protein
VVVSYPSLDPRRARELLAELERMAAMFLPAWRGAGEQGDAGHALLRIAARLAEHVTYRLDETPRRDVIAFFDALDIPPEPPQPARAPLVFSLAEERATPVYAPARIQVAASGADGEEVLFETLDALTLTPARLTYLAAVDTARDRIEEAPPGVLALVPPEPVPAYQVATFANVGSQMLQITPAVGLEAGDSIRIEGKVYRLNQGQDGLFPLADPLESAVAAKTPIEKVTFFDTFAMRNLQAHTLYVGHAELLNLAQPATLRLVFTPPQVLSRLLSLGLEFQLYGTRADEKAPDWHSLGLIGAEGGTLSLFKAWKGSVDELEVRGHKSHWLRARLLRAVEGQATLGTRISRVALRVESDTAVCTSTTGEGSQTLTQALHNGTPLPLTTSFLPFGTEPRRFDTFALAAPEALSKKGATLTLNVELADGSAEGLGMPYARSSLPYVILYAIARNGRLQALALANGALQRWQALDHPLDKDLASGKATQAASEGGRSLRLDGRLPPQAVRTDPNASSDLVMVRDLGGRLWSTTVSKRSGRSGAFERTDWRLLPALPAGAKGIDHVLLPNPDRASYPQLGAYLLAVTSDGLYRLAFTVAGEPSKVWQALQVTGEVPAFGTRALLVPVLSQDWPAVPAASALQFVLLDEQGALWKGELSSVKSTAPTWEKLDAGDGSEASAEVRPVAAALNHDRFAVFAATKAARELFAFVDGGDDGRELRKPPEPFPCQAGTSLLCVPGYRDMGADQPLAMAFAEDRLALWSHKDRIETVDRPAYSGASGILLPGRKVSEEPPTLILCGERETLFRTTVSHPPRKVESQLASEAAFGSWFIDSFDRDYQNPTLSWEYFDGNGWCRLDQGFSDTTNHLAASGEIQFCVPDDIQPTDIAGQTDYWIRARLVGGDYGRARYVVTTTPLPTVTSTPFLYNLPFNQTAEPATEQTIEVDTSQLNPPEILRINACFELKAARIPECVLTENNRSVRNQTQASAVAEAEYELFTGALAIDTSAPGRALYLGFSKRFDVRPLTLWVDAEEQAGEVELDFEVWSRDSWQRVVADDETHGLHRRGFIRVSVDVVPTRAALFGREQFWLRIRPRTQDHAWSPDLNGVFVNAGMAVQAKSIRQEILGSSLGDPDQRYFLSQTPALPESVELRVREAVSEEEREVLEAATDDGTAIATYADLPGQWVRWERVDSFLGKDGDARVYRLDPATGEVRFGNGRQGRIPLVGRDAIRAIQYQSGGGRSGNVPDFTIAGLKSSLESVEQVANPIAAAGGVDAPSVDALIATAPARLRHSQQALTAPDFEALALAWSPDIVRARCRVPPAPGQPITVVIALRTGARCPQPSLVEREALARHLRAQAWGGLAEGAIRVAGPTYTRLSVQVEILAESSRAASAVENAARERLKALLHPLDGGPDGTGWPFGRRLWESDVLRAVADIPSLDRVGQVTIAAKQSVALDRPSPVSLICADEQDIRVTVTFPGAGD